MKERIFNRAVATVGAALVLCLAVSATAGAPGVTQKYKHATEPFDDTQVKAVEALPANAVLVRSKYRGEPFWTETRKGKIDRFKCSQ
jgi:hypothetical protein